MIKRKKYLNNPEGFMIQDPSIQQLLKQISRCGEVRFGIRLKHHRKNFPWCLRAKFQILPLRNVIFAVNITTRVASNLDFLQFCSSQPLLSPGTVHQKFE